MKSTIYQEIVHMIDQQFFPIVKIMRFIDNIAYVRMSASLSGPNSQSFFFKFLRKSGIEAQSLSFRIGISGPEIPALGWIFKKNYI